MIYSPNNFSDLFELLNKRDDNTYLLAGGTDLIIKLKNNKTVDYNIINLTKLEELKIFREDEENYCIGSLVTMTQLINNKVIKNRLKALYLAAYNLGSNQIRNLATIGGNISNASQSADCSLALFSLDARINIINSDGDEKIIPIDEFIVGREKTILKPKEILKEIIIPKNNSINLFGKIGSRTGVTISKVSCAMNFIFDSDVIRDARIFLGAVGAKPVRARLLEKVMKVNDFRNINLGELQACGCNEIEKAIPTRNSKYYKREAIQGLLEDMLKELIDYE